MRHGSIYYNNTPEDDCLHSINNIAEQIFAAKVDLDLNEEDFEFYNKIMEIIRNVLTNELEEMNKVL